jgi:hypothetical protein
MVIPLYDLDGELTALGTGLRIGSLVVGVASGLALVPASIFGLLSPMICGGGGCTTTVEIAIGGMVLSPVLLLISAMCGVVAFRNPSWSLMLWTLIPAMIAATAFLVGFE